MLARPGRKPMNRRNRMSSRRPATAWAAAAPIPLLALAAAWGLAAPAPAAAQEAAWTAPRTVDGRPDLQGIWSNNTATPLERPEAFAGKDALTDEELAELRARAAELRENEQAGNLLGDLLVQQLVDDPNFQEFDPRHRQLQLLLAGRARARRPHVAHRRPARRPPAADDRGGDGPLRGARRGDRRATRRGPRACPSPSAASPSARRTCWPATTATSRSCRRPTTSWCCRS